MEIYGRERAFCNLILEWVRNAEYLTCHSDKTLTWSPGDCESQDLLTSGSFYEPQATSPFEECHATRVSGPLFVHPVAVMERMSTKTLASEGRRLGKVAALR